MSNLNNSFLEAFDKDYIVLTHVIADHWFCCGTSTNYEDCPKSDGYWAEAEIVYQKVLEERRG